MLLVALLNGPDKVPPLLIETPFNTTSPHRLRLPVLAIALNGLPKRPSVLRIVAESHPLNDAALPSRT